MSLPSLALPGDLLAAATKYAPGPGVHQHAGTLYASIAGSITETAAASTKSAAPSPAAAAIATLPRLSIPRGPSLPEVDAVVLAKVTRLSLRQATLEILVVADSVCREPFQAIIRREDVRATEKDRVVIADCFRVGDVVRGVVISLGDQTSYYLSTASNELGVILATSQDGNQMYPISWQEYKDPVTGLTEKRKVAKPF